MGEGAKRTAALRGLRVAGGHRPGILPVHPMTTEVETLRLESVPLPAAGTLRLLILREEGWESRLLPASGTLTVGRAEDVDVRIEDRSVSRRQARLHLDGDLVLEDLG